MLPKRQTQRAIHASSRRALLTLCTGAGKTAITFQIAWRLWSAGSNRRGQHRKPKILFLADRKVLVDDPKDKDFAPFGNGRFKIERAARSARAETSTSRPTRPSLRTRTGLASTESLVPTSSTSWWSTSATGATPGTIPAGRKSSSSSNLPISSASRPRGPL
jgi:hypothetical protein